MGDEDDCQRREDLEDEAAKFMRGFRSMALGTVNPDGEPEASHAPFVIRPGEGFYVYVSELSRHTANLMHTGRASVLLAADEQSTREPFARKRLSFRCSTSQVPRGHDRFERVLDAFSARFGEIVDTLRRLEDFHLFALAPEIGTYVRGFAQAHRFEGVALEGLLRASHVSRHRATRARETGPTPGQ